VGAGRSQQIVGEGRPWLFDRFYFCHSSTNPPGHGRSSPRTEEHESSRWEEQVFEILNRAANGEHPINSAKYLTCFNLLALGR